MKRFRFKGIGCAYSCEKQPGRVLFKFSFPCKKDEDVIRMEICPMDMIIYPFRIKGKKIWHVYVNLTCYSSTDAAFKAVISQLTPVKVKF